MRPIDADAVLVEVKKAFDFSDRRGQLAHAISCIQNAPTIDAEPVRHGRWIECDYKTLEHGEIESAYKAGLCCSECRTGFKKNRITYKAFCPACGAKMDGGAENG